MQIRGCEVDNLKIKAYQGKRNQLNGMDKKSSLDKVAFILLFEINIVHCLHHGVPCIQGLAKYIGFLSSELGQFWVPFGTLSYIHVSKKFLEFYGISLLFYCDILLEVHLHIWEPKL